MPAQPVLEQKHYVFALSVPVSVLMYVPCRLYISFSNSTEGISMNVFFGNSNYHF